MFAEGSPFVGGLKYLFLDGVGKDPNTDYAATIPQGTFMVYQLMFAIITPGLISGAFAERIRFSAMALFSTLWVLIVYFRWLTWCGAKAVCSTPTSAARSGRSTSPAAPWFTLLRAFERWCSHSISASASGIRKSR